MNTIDNTKIVSTPACENSIPFRSILLLSEIALLDAIPSQWRQSQSLFFCLRIISCVPKDGRPAVHRIRLDKIRSEKIYLIPISGPAA